MKNKKLIRKFTVLLAALVIMCGFSVTAYAGGGDESDDTPTPVTEETPAPEETTGGYEPQPLTPDGNMSLVDDISGEASGDKQFITVVTKSGNYFYIIIDRAEDGENTVHFLNQVDEADLTALMEDGQTEAPVCSCTDKCAPGSVNTACPVCSVNMSECAGVEAEPEPEETEQPQEEEKGGGMGILLVVLLVAAAGGGAFYYFKILKPTDRAGGRKSMKLVIAEKPSVGAAIAAVLGANEKRSGYFEGSGYLVSWCIGHLISLADAATYNEQYRKWKYDDLPIVPQ